MEKKKKTTKSAEPKDTETKKKKKADDEEIEKPSGEKGNVKGLRAGAIILWVLAVACEVGAFFAFSWGMRNNNLTFGTPISQYPEFWLLVLALVLDAVFCIIAAQLWKKSNRIKPCLADSKLVRTLWHQLGVIMVLVCFLPIGIFLLVKSDKLNKKTKTILLVLVAALLAGSTAASVDYKQPSEEEVQKLQEEAENQIGDGDVYWTRFGKSYHLDPNCQSLRNTKAENLFSGPLDDDDAENDITSAFEANRWDPCDFCADGGDAADDAADEVLDEVIDEVND